MPETVQRYYLDSTRDLLLGRFRWRLAVPLFAAFTATAVACGAAFLMLRDLSFDSDVTPAYWLLGIAVVEACFIWICAMITSWIARLAMSRWWTACCRWSGIDFEQATQIDIAKDDGAQEEEPIDMYDPLKDELPLDQEDSTQASVVDSGSASIGQPLSDLGSTPYETAAPDSNRSEHIRDEHDDIKAYLATDRDRAATSYENDPFRRER